ncbi:MAG TPA: DUF4340 domain-containing protein, partial [Verrucomicrobiae bacterium]|nr:DUF4340 domain-containing protein [Verrucomicrobiae bacterium]
LEPPVATFAVTEGTNRYLLHLGNMTALRDQMYATMPGSGEVLVTDASILKALPASVHQWRSPMLLHLDGRPFDHIQIRAGQRVLEFARDVTNAVWRISKPTPARANHQRIVELLQQLQTARVKEFVTDSPTADLEKYGLQTPELELSFALDTNRVTALEFGASPTNDPGSVYVRRLSTTNIVLADRALFDQLSQPSTAFHDPRLISTDPAQITMIHVKGASPFTVARQTNGAWVITEPNPMPADAELMKKFLGNVFQLTIEKFPKDVPTDADLKQFGLVPPRMSYAFYAMRTNAAGAATNALVTQVDFGGSTDEALMYARRSDEVPVYLTLDTTYLLPTAPWRLRDRRIFDFAPTNVTAVVLSGGGKTNRVTRGQQGWTADPIVNAALQEVLYNLGQLQARDWVDKGTAAMPRYGLKPDGLMLDVELTPGSPTAPPPIMFGKPAVRNNIYAATVLPGEVEPTFFIFPGELYQSLLNAFGGQ